MAHNVEPMDVDSDFDNKENSYHHSNVLPCTEKGYEELDVSELNMKLRYSITPASSPMSKSYTAHTDNRHLDSDDTLNCTNDSLTRSLNSTITRNDSLVKTFKALPLQAIPAEHIVDSNRNPSVLRQIDTTMTDNNVTVTISPSDDIDENLSLPSSSSSALNTPEATTPVNDLKADGGSPIMRGLKTVLNMFRPSQSPIPPEVDIKPELSTPEVQDAQVVKPPVNASTPIAAHRNKDVNTSRRSSPLKDSIVFNDDLEKELHWKDETTILFSEEKIPIHKLFFQNNKNVNMGDAVEKLENNIKEVNPNTSVEYMDISYNDTVVHDTTINIKTEIKEEPATVESDNEFVDCETTFTNNTSQLSDTEPEAHHKELLIENKDSLPEDIPILNTIENNAVTPTGVTALFSINNTEPDFKPATGNTVEQNNINNNETINFGLIETSAIGDVTLENKEEADSTISIINELNELIENKSVTKEAGVEITTEQQLTSQAIGEIKENIEVQSTELITSQTKDECYQMKTETEAINKIELRQEEYEKISNENDINATLETKIVDDIPKQDTDVLLNIDGVLVTKIDYISTINADPILESTVEPQAVNKIETIFENVTENKTIIQKVESATNDSVNIIEKTSIEENNESFEDSEQIIAATDILTNTTQTIEAQNNITTEVNNIETVEKPDKILADIPLPDLVQIASSQFLDATEHIDNLPKEICLTNEEKSIETATLTPENPADIPLPEDSDMEQEQIVIPDIEPTVANSENVIAEQNTTISIENEIENVIPIVPASVLNTGEINNATIVEESQVISEPTSNDATLTDNNINDKPQNLEPMDINESASEMVVADLVYQTISMSNPEIPAENIVQADTIGDTTIVMEDLEPKAINNEIQFVHEVENGLPILFSNSNVTNISSNQSIEISESNSATTFVIETQSNETFEFESQTEIIDEEVPSRENLNAVDIIEEMVESENNSPYVSLMTGIDTQPEKDEKFEEVDAPFNTTVPSSPPIVSKGYNFNFDDIDDPFASKVKIRQSPPPNTPSKVESDITTKNDKPRDFINRRKSQPIDKKRPLNNKKKLNSTIDTKCTKQDMRNKNHNVEIISDAKANSIPDKEKAATDVEDKVTEVTVMPERDNNTDDVSSDIIPNQVTLDKDLVSIKEKSSSETESVNEVKASSSTEHSTYYSADTSSVESITRSKNVFNLPEIDDANFNPFATKSKMRQSPTRDFDTDNPFGTRNKIMSSPDSSIIATKNSTEKTPSKVDITTIINSSNDKMDIEIMEKETPANISFLTTSSKVTDDKNGSHEVHTEDEDTEEGPFLEADEGIDGNDDMIQFNELPARVDNDDGELFIDAEAFEFLLNQNKCNIVTDSGKESLFLKFDPLFAKRMSSTGVLAALSQARKGQTPPTNITKDERTVVAGPSNMNVTFDGDMNDTQESNDELNVTVSKPTMVVTPAVNSTVTPRNKSITPNRSTRRSITSSPAMAVIDRLLSLSANNSPVAHETTVSREQTEAELALVQLRELLAEKEMNVFNLRSESKELKDRLASMESQVRMLEADGQNRVKRINDLTNELAEKTKVNKSMAAVVEEYERTIASLIAGIEHDKKKHAEEKMKLINERDEQTAHLTSMEVSFSDLHSKYEKSKQIILSCKANELTYQKSLKQFEESVAKMQRTYDTLKQHATTQLNQANQEFEKLNKTHDSEILKLKAMIKRKDVHITSLEESLAQKIKANDELTAICDELINKVV